MNTPSLMYWNDSVQRGQSYRLDFLYKITAAKTVVALNGQGVTLPTFDAYASQAVMDTFLQTPTGLTSEFLLAQFDATSMGTDAFGALVNMGGANGQVKSIQAMTASLYSGANGLTLVSEGVVSSATLTSSTEKAEIAVGQYGNIGLKTVLTGVDALTSGLIVISIHWMSK